MDSRRVYALRSLLAGTGWVERAAVLGRALRGAGHGPGGCSSSATPDDEPWHLAAHLADEARWTSTAQLGPTLVRWAPPAGAPPHLSVGLDRLRAAGRAETVLVVAPAPPPASLLERVDDARRAGAVILAVDAGDDDLAELADEELAVRDGAIDGRTFERLLGGEPAGFDLATHLVTVAAGREEAPARRFDFGRRLAALRS